MATLLERAIQVACQVHAGKVDLIGDPYILHPLRVMGVFHSESGRLLGVLHDVLEDCGTPYPPDVTSLLEDLPPGVVQALKTLTRMEGETYVDYIDRIAVEGGIAKTVKRADLLDNLNPVRLDSFQDQGKRKRLEARYWKALKRLMEVDGP